MLRKINRRTAVVKWGIRYYEIQDVNKPEDIAHILRIDMAKARPFVIGSISLGFNPKKNQKGEIIKMANKRQLSKILPEAQYGKPPISVFFNNKRRNLKPLWITNGTFFGDDCEYNPMWVPGSIVNQNRAVTDPKGSLDEKKKYRGVFLQKLNSDGSVTIDFRHSGHSASYWAAQGWYSAIGGAGILIENGTVHEKDYMGSPDKGMFKEDQWYCAGPVIAANSDRSVLYLIMDRTFTQDGLPRYGNRGRPWGKEPGQMGHYLRNEFLREINSVGDGTIPDALVYDGGGSRGVCLRKKGEKFGLLRGFNPIPDSADLNKRFIPNHICLWG